MMIDAELSNRSSFIGLSSQWRSQELRYFTGGGRVQILMKRPFESLVFTRGLKMTFIGLKGKMGGALLSALLPHGVKSLE